MGYDEAQKTTAWSGSRDRSRWTGCQRRHSIRGRKPTDYVLLSIKDANKGTIITQHASDGAVLGTTWPRSGSHYWHLNANATSVTITKKDRSFTVTRSQLSACFRETKSDKLNWIKDDCNASGAREGAWE